MTRPQDNIRTAVLAALVAITTGCGYHSLVADRPAAERYAVVVLPPKEPQAEALSQVAVGVRAELSRHGALRAGSHPPRVVVELVRSDERGTGIAATAGGPRARGSAVAVVARAWIEQRAGAPPALDTGDLRRVGRFEPGATVALDAEARREALRGAAEAVGEALARRLLGRPVPSDEPLGGS